IVPPMKKLLWQMTSLFSMCGSLTAYIITARQGKARQDIIATAHLLVFIMPIMVDKSSCDK
ncbi:hypothetical protein AB7Y64_19170, partial [Providencia rettgeri]